MNTVQKIRTARRFGLKNAGRAMIAARRVKLPYHVACALLEMESGGKNTWGNDVGGVFAGYGTNVNKATFRAFLHEITENGRTSNGVGPCQITWPGFFAEMQYESLRPWVPFENMLFGFKLLKRYYDSEGNWRDAGARYNGADVYGAKLSVKIRAWKERLQ